MCHAAHRHLLSKPAVIEAPGHTASPRTDHADPWRVRDRTFGSVWAPAPNVAMNTKPPANATFFMTWVFISASAKFE